MAYTQIRPLTTLDPRREQVRKLELGDGEEVDYFEDAGGVDDEHDDEPPVLPALRGVPERETLPKRAPHEEEQENLSRKMKYIRSPPPHCVIHASILALAPPRASVNLEAKGYEGPRFVPSSMP